MSPLRSKAQWKFMAKNEPAMFNRWVKHTKKKFKDLPKKVHKEEFSIMYKLGRGIFNDDPNRYLQIYKNPTPTEWRKHVPIQGARGYIDPHGNLFMEGYEEKQRFGSAIHEDIQKALELKYDPYMHIDPDRFGIMVITTDEKLLILGEGYDGSEEELGEYRTEIFQLLKEMQKKNTSVNWYFDGFDSSRPPKTFKGEGMTKRIYEASPMELMADFTDKKRQRRSFSANAKGKFRFRKDVHNIDDTIYPEDGWYRTESTDVSYKYIEFAGGHEDNMFKYYTPTHASMDFKDSYIAVAKEGTEDENIHIQIDESLQGHGLAEIVLEAFVYRYGEKVIRKGRITNPNMIKVLAKINQHPKFVVSDEDDEYIISERIHQKKITEEYHNWVKKDFMSGIDFPVQILKNPSRREIMREIDSYSDNRDLRGCVDPATGNIYCWDVDALHDEIVPEIKEVDEDAVIRFDMENNTIHTKLQSVEDKAWYKDMFRQNENFMTLEPEFEFTFIEKASGVGSMDGDDGRQNSDDYFKLGTGPRDVIQYDDTEDKQRVWASIGDGQHKKKKSKYKFIFKENVQTKAQKIMNEFGVSKEEAVDLAKRIEKIPYFDMSQYEEWQDLWEAVHSTKSKTQLEKEGKKLVFQNTYCKVYRIDNYWASATYASRATWCITGSEDDWDAYNRDFQFYFVETDEDNLGVEFKDYCIEVDINDMVNAGDREEDFTERSFQRKEFFEQWYNTWCIGIPRQGEMDDEMFLWNAKDTKFDMLDAVGTQPVPDMFLGELGIPDNIF